MKIELLKALTEENQKITDALKTIGYETIKIDLIQIYNAKTGGVDIQIWARSENENQSST